MKKSMVESALGGVVDVQDHFSDGMVVLLCHRCWHHYLQFVSTHSHNSAEADVLSGRFKTQISGDRISICVQHWTGCRGVRGD